MYIFGAGGHCKVIIEILEACRIPVSGIYVSEIGAEEVLGYSVSAFSSLKEIDGDIGMIVGIGSNSTRKRIAEQLTGIGFGRALHPFSAISPSSGIEDGCVVMAGVAVNGNVRIGRHCIINTNCSIDYDCIIDDYVHISPNACLSENIYIGTGAHICSGAAVVSGVKVGKWAVVGAGSVVNADVPDYAVVAGNPSKIIKYNNTLRYD